MKKNYFLIFLSLFILGLLFKKLGWVGSDIVFVTSIVLLIIVYAKSLLNINEDYEERKTTQFIFRVFLMVTLIGILFRHQFWYFPFWYLIFKVLWPAFLLIVIIHLIGIYKIRNDLKVEYRIQFIREVLVPLLIVIILAFPTFFLKTDNFVKIFKSSSYEEKFSSGN